MNAITALDAKIKSTLEKGASVSDLNTLLYTTNDTTNPVTTPTTPIAPTTTTAPKTDSSTHGTIHENLSSATPPKEVIPPTTHANSTAPTATTAKTNPTIIHPNTNPVSTGTTTKVNSAPIATPPPKVNSVTTGTGTTTTVNKTPSANVNSVTTPKVNLATVSVSPPNVNSVIHATTTTTTTAAATVTAATTTIATTASPIKFILTANNITAPSQTGTDYDNKYRIILKKDSTLCISARTPDKHIIITEVNSTDSSQIWYKLNYIPPKRNSKLVDLCVLKNANFCEIIRIGTTVENTNLVEENGLSRDNRALFSCSTATGFSTINLTGNSNQCLDVIGDVVDGALVFVNPANNSDTQQWEFQPA